MPIHIAEEDWTPSLRKVKDCIEDAASRLGYDDCSRACATGIAKAAENAFKKRYRVTRASGYVCCCMLFGKRCRQYSGYPCEYGSPPGVDHRSLWKRNGKPYLFLFEPYSLSGDTLGKLAEWCEKRELTCEIISESPYFFGRSLAVVLKRKEDL